MPDDPVAPLGAARAGDGSYFDLYADIPNHLPARCLRRQQQEIETSRGSSPRRAISPAAAGHVLKRGGGVLCPSAAYCDGFDWIQADFWSPITSPASSRRCSRTPAGTGPRLATATSTETVCRSRWRRTASTAATTRRSTAGSCRRARRFQRLLYEAIVTPNEVTTTTTTSAGPASSARRQASTCTRSTAAIRPICADRPVSPAAPSSSRGDVLDGELGHTAERTHPRRPGVSGRRTQRQHA